MTRLVPEKMLRVCVTIALVAMVLSGVLFSAISVSKQINELRRADSDNIPWNLAQTEVEYSNLRSTIASVLHLIESGSNAAALERVEDIRRAFDLLYSRIITVSESDLYLEVRENPRTVSDYSAVKTYLDRVVPLIDASEAEVIDSLGELMLETRMIADPVRNLALSGVSVSAKAADREREKVIRYILVLASLILLSFLALLGLTFMIWFTARDLRRSVLVAEMATARLAAVIAISPLPIVVSDEKMRIIEYNAASEKAFGFSRYEAIGAKVSNLIIPKDLRSDHIAGANRYFATGIATIMDSVGTRTRALRKDGSEFPIEISLRAGNGPDGQIFVAFIRDLTKDIERETEMSEARDLAQSGERSKERLLNTVSHEMRTPLHGILAMLELLERAPAQETQRKYLGLINNSARILLHHVDNILQAASDTGDQLLLEKSNFDLCGLVSDVVSEQQVLAERNGNRLHLTSQLDEKIQVHGDIHALRQVLVNLLANAIKFTRNGSISLTVLERCKTNELEFRVQDNGIGIPHEDQDAIFQDFFTKDAGSSRLSAGTGLGLGITRRIIEAMGGKIEFESSPGKGSVFWFFIPLTRALEPTEKTKEMDISKTRDVAKSTALEAMNILVVDDSEVNLLVIQEALTRFGVDISSTKSGREGVDLASRHRFDCILMDISLPDLSGTDALRLIREGNGRSKNAPILAVTAHALPDDRIRFLASGFDRVITKPFSIGKLHEHIAAAVEEQTELTKREATGAVAQIDTAQLGELTEMFGASKTADLLGVFLEESGESIQDISDELTHETADQAKIANELHRFGGSASLFGATELAGLLRGFETDLNAQGSVPTQDQLVQLRDLLERSVTALHTVIQSKG